LTFAVLSVPTSGCFLKVLSAALRYLTREVHFTEFILVHLSLSNQSLKGAEGSTEASGRENRGGKKGRAIKMK